jgi:hypothetical protein
VDGTREILFFTRVLLVAFKILGHVCVQPPVEAAHFKKVKAKVPVLN